MKKVALLLALLILVVAGIVHSYTYDKVAKLSNYASFAAAKIALGTTKSILNVDRLATLTADQNCTNTMAINIVEGGSINHGSYNLTINGPFTVKGPPRQVFYGTGVVTFGASSTNEIHADYFGATGKGVTDDSDAFTKAAVSLSNGGGVVKGCGVTASRN